MDIQHPYADTMVPSYTQKFIVCVKQELLWNEYRFYQNKKDNKFILLHVASISFTYANL